MPADLLAFVHAWGDKLRRQIAAVRRNASAESRDNQNEILTWLQLAEFHLARSYESSAPADAMAYLVSAHQHWGVAQHAPHTLLVGRKMTPSRAGSLSGKEKKAKADEDHSKWIDYAKLMSIDAEGHELTNKVARRFKKSTAAVRPVLQAANLVETREQKRTRKALAGNKLRK